MTLSTSHILPFSLPPLHPPTGLRVHGAGRRAVHAADPQRQAHGPRRAAGGRGDAPGWSGRGHGWLHGGMARSTGAAAALAANHQHIFCTSLQVAVDMEGEGMVSKSEAVLMVEPRHLDQLLHPMFEGALPVGAAYAMRLFGARRDVPCLASQAGPLHSPRRPSHLRHGPKSNVNSTPPKSHPCRHRQGGVQERGAGQGPARLPRRRRGPHRLHR